MVKKRVIILIGLLCLMGLNPFSFSAQGVEDRVVLATIVFKNGSAELSPENENELKKARSALAADPAIGLQIEGYGEKVDLDKGNPGILQKRLQAVQQWFLKQRVDPDRLLIKSSGDSQSGAKNAALQDPFQSQRVEIVRVALKLPSAYLSSTNFEFEPVVEGKEVVHDFVIQNKGAADLKIQNVRTD